MKKSDGQIIGFRFNSSIFKHFFKKLFHRSEQFFNIFHLGFAHVRNAESLVF